MIISFIVFLISIHKLEYVLQILFTNNLFYIFKYLLVFVSLQQMLTFYINK